MSYALNNNPIAKRDFCFSSALRSFRNGVINYNKKLQRPEFAEKRSRHGSDYLPT